MSYELYLRHYARDGVLKNAMIEPLWARYTESVDGDEPLVFALNEQAVASMVASGAGIEAFDLMEVQLRNRELGLVDFVQAFVGIVRNVSIETDEDGVTLVTYECPEGKHSLSWRAVLWFAGVDDRSKFTTIPAETIMKTVVQYNLTGDASMANGRQREGDLDAGMGVNVDIGTDLGAGEVLSAAFMGGNVLTILQRLAAQAGGDFSLRWQGGDDWLFEFHPGQLGEDKSSGAERVLFSLMNGTLLNPRLRRVGAWATAAIAAGEGEGVDREVSEVLGPDYTSGYDLETFVDARNAETNEMRIFQGMNRLQDMRQVEELTFGVVQTSDVFYSPVPVTGRKTYKAGDLVLVDFGGLFTRKIRSIAVDWRVPGSESPFQVGVATEVIA